MSGGDQVTPEGRIWDRAAGGWIGSRIGGSMQTPGEQRHVLHLTENGRCENCCRTPNRFGVFSCLGVGVED